MTGLDTDRQPIYRDAHIVGSCRYWLIRRWGMGERKVCWIMLNPSTADHNADDPTLKRCIHFSRSWGFDGLAVVNLYPWITSQPAECKSILQGVERGEDWAARNELYNLNLEAIREVSNDCELLVAAWGNHASDFDPGWPDRVLEVVENRNQHCIGTNKDGSPKHPLARGKHRVPNDAQPMPWPGVLS